EAPFAKKAPPKAGVKAWPLLECNGVLMAFHHSDDVPPQRELPTIAEFSSPEWTAPTPHQYRMRTHIQEIAENVIDLAHTRFLHGMEEELTMKDFAPEA